MTTAEYNEAVELYADRLYRFVLKQIRDEDKAKDLVQDTFEKLWVNHSDVNAAKARSWMFTTAYRTMIDQIRREKKQGDMEEADPLSMSHDRQYSDLQEILHEALDQLPEIQKTVVLLRDYEGYAYKEIGEMTNLNESQVKVYIFRARKFLKNYIGRMDIVV